MRGLRGQIRELGSVNVNAPQEYEEAGARLHSLTEQRDDLLSAQADLNRIIEDLTGQMRERFAEQFKLLNERFQIAFKALFGGGSAKLMLQDENDVAQLRHRHSRAAAGQEAADALAAVGWRAGR